jgi:hypothetical protein
MDTYWVPRQAGVRQLPPAVRPYADRIDEMRHYAVKTAGAK